MSARRRRVLVDVGGNSSEGRRAVREMRDELRRLGREKVEARIDVNERVVLAKIDRVSQRIAKLKTQEASPKVDLQLAGAYAQLDRLNLRLSRLDAKRINIDVDVGRGALERTAAGLGAVERGVAGVGHGFANVFHQVPIVGGLLESVLGGALSLATSLGSALGSLATAGIGGLARVLGSTGALAGPIGAVVGQVGSLAFSFAALGLVAGGLVIALNAILGAIIALSGALVALVASATAAAAGLGALAIAFGAALIPVAILGIALFQRFQAVLKAHQAQEQKLAQATQEQKTAEQQRAAALDASKRAHEQLSQATVDGNKAIASSIFEVRDAQLALDSSKLGIKEARLNLLEAKKALRDLLHQSGAGGSLNNVFKKLTDVATNPAQQRALIGKLAGGKGAKVDQLALQRAILAVQRAQLGVKDAVNQTGHAERNLADATKKRTDFAKRGLDAYKPYRSALAAVQRANRQLARTQDQSSAAARKYDEALKGLSQTERGSLSRVNALVEGFAKFAKVLTDPVFKAANAVFDKLKGSAGIFEGALKQVGTAIATVVTALGDFLTEPRTLSAFKTMATGAAELVRQLGARAFTSFLRIMREIALTALPTLVSGARRFAGWLGRIADNGRGIQRVTQGLIGHFTTWAGLAWQVLRAVGGIFRAAAGPGKSLAGSLTTIVRKFADWANSDEGQEKIAAFFRRMVRRAKEIVNWIKDAVVWLKDHLPQAAEKASNAFGGIYKSAKRVYDVVKATNDLLHLRLAKAAEGFDPGGTRLGNPRKGGKNDSFSKRLLKELLGFAAGGVVPGSGHGDIVPAMLEPGEFVLRRSVVQQLSLPVLHAMNGGGVTAPAPVAPRVVNHHHQWNLPQPLGTGRYPDTNNLMALVNQIWDDRGGGLS